MSRRTIAEYLLTQPDENYAKISLLKGMPAIYKQEEKTSAEISEIKKKKREKRQAWYQIKKLDPVWKEKLQLRNREYVRNLVKTKEGREKLKKSKKKHYTKWKLLRGLQ